MAAFQTILPNDPRVRPVPYPFRAALALANDAEFMTLDFLEALMAFLNTTGPTPLGDGLGLEVTSSFFFYAAEPTTFSYFAGADARAARSLAASRIDEYLAAGWLDANHAFGDFGPDRRFTRDHALPCYEALSRLGVTLSVFTNHGGTESVQNVGADAAYHRGDVPGDTAYHADLLRDHGARYVWTDSMIVERPRGLRGFVRALLRPASPRLLRDVTLQDGSRFTGFVRFRSTGPTAPNWSSLSSQLQRIPWRRLYTARGAVVVYQHLGVLHKAAGRCMPADVDAVRSRPEAYLAPLRLLKREKDERRLWVCGLSRLLTYAQMIEAAELRPDPDGQTLHLACEPLADLPDTAFAGLTVYADATGPVRLVRDGRTIPLVDNGPDETGRRCLSVPLAKMEDIW